MKLTAHRKCVIGFQIDNVTKYYGTFEKFQRTLVDEFLSWQADIVNEYRREDQLVHHPQF